MPQMAPYNWLILFMYFNMIMMYIMSHYHFMPSLMLNSSSLNIMSKKYYKWMW